MLNVPNYYVPTFVGPSKLDQVLSYCTELSDESKTKVAMIEDIAKLYKLIGSPPLSPANFYALYDMHESILSAIQHNAQIEWNTLQYRSSIQGADF
jgi:hypothetical protein